MITQILGLFLLLLTTQLSAMNATQLFWQTKRAVDQEKVKDRYIDLPTQLIAAVENKNEKEIVRLLDNGANPNTRNKLGMTLLNYAIYYGYQKIVELFLLKGADLNGDENVIPLHIAVIADQPEIIKLLLHAKAKVNAQDKNGKTALMLAIEYNHPEIVALLLQAGADKYKENKYYESAIDIARKKQNQVLIDLLLPPPSLAPKA